MIVTQLHIAGVLLMLLSLLHIGFPKYFNWKADLKEVSLINKQMLSVHCFFIAFFVFAIGLLCVSSANLLMETQLGKRILYFLAAFWFIRLFFQLFVYKKALWQGKKFETAMHILFTLFWTYLAAVFSWAAIA